MAVAEQQQPRRGRPTKAEQVARQRQRTKSPGVDCRSASAEA
jgi:hypothetical protein